MSTNITLPGQPSPLVDTKTGVIAVQWFQFLVSLAAIVNASATEAEMSALAARVAALEARRA